VHITTKTTYAPEHSNRAGQSTVEALWVEGSTIGDG